MVKWIFNCGYCCDFCLTRQEGCLHDSAFAEVFQRGRKSAVHGQCKHFLDLCVHYEPNTRYMTSYWADVYRIFSTWLMGLNYAVKTTFGHAGVAPTEFFWHYWMFWDHHKNTLPSRHECQTLVTKYDNVVCFKNTNVIYSLYFVQGDLLFSFTYILTRCSYASVY